MDQSLKNLILLQYRKRYELLQRSKNLDWYYQYSDELQYRKRYELLQREIKDFVTKVKALQYRKRYELLQHWRAECDIGWKQ